MDASRAKHGHLTIRANTNTTEYRAQVLQQRIDLRSTRLLLRLYGNQELLLELAIFTIMLGITFAMCLLRHHVSS